MEEKKLYRASIVNTSRGALINTEDLITGIKEKKVGAACLDVYEEEGDLFYEDYSGHVVQDDTLVRLIAVVLFFAGGLSLWVYIIAGLIMTETPDY